MRGKRWNVAKGFSDPVTQPKCSFVWLVGGFSFYFFLHFFKWTFPQLQSIRPHCFDAFVRAFFHNWCMFIPPKFWVSIWGVAWFQVLYGGYKFFDTSDFNGIVGKELATLKNRIIVFSVRTCLCIFMASIWMFIFWFWPILVSRKLGLVCGSARRGGPWQSRFCSFMVWCQLCPVTNHVFIVRRHLAMPPTAWKEVVIDGKAENWMSILASDRWNFFQSCVWQPFNWNVDWGGRQCLVCFEFVECICVTILEQWHSLGQIRSGSIRAIRGWKLMKQILKFASFSAPAKRWSLRCLLILNSSRRCRWSGRWRSLSTQELQPVFQMRRKIEKLRVRTVTPFFIVYGR